MKHNPKGPDGYGRVEHSVDAWVEEWMGQEKVYDAKLGGFDIQLTVSPSGRDWHLWVDVPKHFRHPALSVCDHVSLYHKSFRDTD